MITPMNKYRIKARIRKGKIDIKDHDSCGTGVLFNKNNEFRHSVIERSLLSLSNMKHRGALSYDGMTTDGCGILLDIDRKFFQKKLIIFTGHLNQLKQK